MPIDAMGQDNAALSARMAALENYAHQYLGLLDQAGIGYHAKKVMTPGGGANESVAFWDYVVSYTDSPGYPGTLLNPHAMMGTDPAQLMNSSLGNARAAESLKQSDPVMWAQVYGSVDDSPEAQGLPRELTGDPTYDTSYTYNVELGPNGLYGAMNPNRIGESPGMYGGYDVPPPAFGTPAAGGIFPTADPVECQPLPPAGGSGVSTVEDQPGPAAASGPMPRISDVALRIRPAPTDPLSLLDSLDGDTRR